MNTLDGLVGAVDEQDGTTSASSLCEQKRAGGTNLDVEALADDRACLTVEQDGDLIARRVLELLDHQLATLRGRAPVHLAQRLALLVVADAMQIEATRAAQQQASSVLSVGSALREEAVELDQAWVDEQGPGSGERDLGPLEPECVLEHCADVEEEVAPAAHSWERVTPVPRVERRPALAESGHVLDEHERRRRQVCTVLEPELDVDVVAFEPLPGLDLAVEPHGPLREPDPEPREQRGEQESKGDRVERLRAKRARDDVGQET